MREKLADSTRKNIKNLYQNRVDGPIACQVLVQNYPFLKMFLVEIRQVFPQLLYLHRPPKELVAFKTNQRSENHRFGLDVRVGEGGNRRGRTWFRGA